MNEMKERAIKLRREGFSYSEILNIIPVAKSTLSGWLSSVNLTKSQEQRLTQKKLDAAKRSWEKRKETRINETKIIKKKAEKEIDHIDKRTFFIIGAVLYWCEGSKEKKYRIGERVAFSNSDHNMVNIFKKWLQEICLIKDDDIIYELYVHENHNPENIKKYWAKNLNINKDNIKTYFKKDNKRNYKKNIGKDYHGLIKIRVRKSVNLNRKIEGWINGIYKHCRVV